MRITMPAQMVFFISGTSKRSPASAADATHDFHTKDVPILALIHRWATTTCVLHQQLRRHCYRIRRSPHPAV